MSGQKRSTAQTGIKTGQQGGEGRGNSFVVRKEALPKRALRQIVRPDHRCEFCEVRKEALPKRALRHTEQGSI